MSTEPVAMQLPQSVRSRTGTADGGLSRGVVTISLMLSALHLLNFVNYTVLREYFNPPAARSALLVISCLVLLPMSVQNLRFHFSRSWDMYLICALALLSAAYSSNPSSTLKYGAWLALAVYVGTELAARVRTPRDIVTALGIVLLPASLLVAAVNVTLGSTVVGGGRHFGALGSHHVDTAYAMNFICLFLALRAVPVELPAWPRWLRLTLWVVLAWALYQAVFGLTRSVWLGVLLAGGLYYFRQKLSFGRLAGVLGATLAVLLVFQVLGADAVLPEEVQGRLEVTEQRIADGEIDPRVEGIRFALQHSMAHPFGSGYAILSSHNSYFNLLLYMGWPGLLLSLLAIARSVVMVSRHGLPWVMFFAIGATALLVHAFFEVQSIPGQANFVPLLLWYALSRARLSLDESAIVTAVPRRRPTFVQP